MVDAKSDIKLLIPLILPYIHFMWGSDNHLLKMNIPLQRRVWVLYRISAWNLKLASRLQISSYSIAFTFALMCFEKAWIRLFPLKLSVKFQSRLGSWVFGGNHFKRRKNSILKTWKRQRETTSISFTRTPGNSHIKEKYLGRVNIAYIPKSYDIKKKNPNIS